MKLPSSRSMHQFRVVFIILLNISVIYLLFFSHFSPLQQTTEDGGKEGEEDEGKTATDFDVIIVPGGGSQRAEDPSTLPAWTIRRLDRAAEIWTEQSKKLTTSSSSSIDGNSAKISVAKAPVIIVLSAGTTHRPNYINKNGWPILEATSEALYLLHHHHIPKEFIQRETTSLDTIGNAYFTRVYHLDPMLPKWRQILVITSEFHVVRTRKIFQFVLNELRSYSAFQEVAPFLSSHHRNVNPYILTFMAVSDDGIDEKQIHSRKEKEKMAQKQFQELVRNNFQDEKSRNLQVFHEWLFTQHGAYSTHSGIVSAANMASLSPEVLDTY